MMYSVERSPTMLKQRQGFQLQLILAGFLAGLAATGTLWWISVGPRQTISLYWLTSPDNDIYYVQQERAIRSLNQEQAISQGIQELIEGPRDPRLISALPSDTQVLNVKIEGEDVFLDFSPEFAGGGGSTSMLGRITQVLYTATSHNENAKVWVTINNEALETLGGEGLILEQPLTRDSFEPTFKDQVFFEDIVEYYEFDKQYANQPIEED